MSGATWWSRRAWYDRAFWLLHPLDNAFFGIWFTLFHREYRCEGFVFEYPRALVSLGFRSRFLFDLHEREERALVRRYVRSEDRVVELGGCLGVVACVTADVLAPSSKHVVVEANPALLPTLRRNRDRNGFAFEIEGAAAGVAGAGAFLEGAYVTTGRCEAGSRAGVEVPGTSLAELHERHGGFTALVADIEGGELDLLRGGADVLRAYRLVLIEIHDRVLGPGGAAECRAILAEAGLECVASMYGTEAWLRSAADGGTA